ncbi:hypothetical protein RYX45_01450 [Alkalihalophilus pseudofirmus]|uniref:Uncharacterized protein n=1 Tax=Alkalihalophilus pseudofirmus TaxID=79885 RepID=A0AAJ2KY00_ALKPS|nr:hypothetical protein [Alkalihalophilus pseudofirmus]MDV2883828.1 hypothetical protein [Alkalihalophilus pseudofirmus]
MKIDLSDIGLVRESLVLVGRVYNHPDTNQHTKQFIRFELQRLLGNEYDIKGFLNEPVCKVKPDIS